MNYPLPALDNIVGVSRPASPAKMREPRRPTELISVKIP